jgi:hypothetical protein
VEYSGYEEKTMNEEPKFYDPVKEIPVKRNNQYGIGPFSCENIVAKIVVPDGFFYRATPYPWRRHE